MAALGLLTFLTNCATTSTEKERPTVMSQPMAAPTITDARRPDSVQATAAARPATPGASAADAVSAAALTADKPDPAAPRAAAASQDMAVQGL